MLVVQHEAVNAFEADVCISAHQARTNAAMATVSGYAFCYPCLFNFVSQEGCCPVTRIPATIDSVRRLYQST